MANIAHYQQCLNTWRDRENMMSSAMVLDSIAQTISHMGNPARAATLLVAAATIRERASIKLTANEQASCDQTMRDCHTLLGDTGLAATWSAGRTLTLAQAISLALQPLGMRMR